MNTETLRKRGRPPIETPYARLARLRKEVRAAEDAVKAADKEKFSILGEAVAAAAKKDPDFKARLREIVPQHVKSPAAKEMVEPLVAA